MGRGLNWIPDSGTTLRLDLESWRKYFGFDKNGAAADMIIDVDLDALTIDWSVSGPIPQVPAGAHFVQDILGQAVGPLRPAGPLLRVPTASLRLGIDPRR